MIRNSAAGSGSGGTHWGALGVFEMGMMLVDCAPPARSTIASRPYSSAPYACCTIPVIVMFACCRARVCAAARAALGMVRELHPDIAKVLARVAGGDALKDAWTF